MTPYRHHPYFEVRRRWVGPWRLSVFGGYVRWVRVFEYGDRQLAHRWGPWVGAKPPEWFGGYS